MFDSVFYMKLCIIIIIILILPLLCGYVSLHLLSSFHLFAPKKRSNIYLFFTLQHRITLLRFNVNANFLFCLFKRLLQTPTPYKITSNIKNKHCVNTINNLDMYILSTSQRNNYIEIE